MPNNVTVVRFQHVLELRCCDPMQVGLYYAFELLCHDLHLVGFHIKSITNFSSTFQEGNKKSSLGYKQVELSLLLKTASYINNTCICNIYCVDIQIF